MNHSPIYLDHSATTPVDPRVVEVMLPFWTEDFGNPSSVHAFGRKAKQGLEEARRKLAFLLGCRPGELVFTGSGSESDNLALRGILLAGRGGGKAPHLITSVIEHEAILATAEQLRDVFGCGLTIVAVDRFGRVDPAAIEAALRPETVLISIMAANNEIGTLQPILEIGALARERGILFHTDAVQAANHAAWNLKDQPIDLFSIAPHKFYGPKGIGVLYIREGIHLQPSLTGGGQESGRRPGTSNVAFAAGAARALEIATGDRETHSAHCRALRDRLIAGLTASFSPDELVLTGHPVERLPHHASFAFRHITGNDILIQLDAVGLAASSGSACASGSPEPSAVLEATGLGPDWATGGLRLTVGRQTTRDEIEKALGLIPPAIRRVQQFAAALR